MKRNAFARICAAALMIAVLSVSAFAATSVQDQMAANSAAWHIANAAGDKATCDALHAANEKLASQAAGSGGSASFNSASGTWSITDSSGSTTKSSSSSNGKTTTSTYTTTSSSGRTSSSSSSSYSDSSISAYKSAGGTNEGLQTAYNNDANRVSSSGGYGDQAATNSAAAEAAVAKELLGLTNTQAQQLQRDLEASKQEYEAAASAYKAAVASGNTAAAEAAKAQMNAAHDSAQATRAQYNYTGDDPDYYDGGYYYGEDGTPKSRSSSGGSGGGFFVTDITATYKITASCNEGGSITPSGVVNVKEGESKTYTITPSSGFDIADVVVDGVSKGAVKTYTFSNVTESHTISASFRANGKVDINSLDVTDNLGTDLSKNSIKSGYGIKVSVPVTATNVSDVNVTLSYNFGDGAKSVTLQKSIGVYVLPINTSSKTLARCVYIPVATADGTYTLTVTVTAKNAAGELLSDTSSATITVLGSMYEDDFTGDS